VHKDLKEMDRKLMRACIVRKAAHRGA
jgi:hypothetical protein